MTCASTDRAAGGAIRPMAFRSSGRNPFAEPLIGKLAPGAAAQASAESRLVKPRSLARSGRRLAAESPRKRLGSRRKIGKSTERPRTAPRTSQTAKTVANIADSLSKGWVTFARRSTARLCGRKHGRRFREREGRAVRDRRLEPPAKRDRSVRESGAGDGGAVAPESPGPALAPESGRPSSRQGTKPAERPGSR